MEAFNLDTKICFKIDQFSSFFQQRTGTKKRYPNTLNNGQFEIKCHLYSVDIRDEADGAISAIGIRKAFRIVLECQGQNFAITKYHAFHDEVLYYKRYIWRCNGPCRERGSTYGWIRRLRNEPPGGFIRQPWTGNVQTDDF
ncbi:hypothetical protein niasHT_038904 [Heterodera trifolii]|uniref:Spartan-like zinc binding domain-containing protein n=1 Tax=Heterodera trifolii TaxID=157864 RepID=A0ABD2IK22_9BILA